MYEGCPESIQPFWISREPVCGLDIIWQPGRGDLNCASVKSHSSVGLVSRQWDAVDWACVLCDHSIHNDRASRSASLRKCACPFYSSRAGFFGKASHHPGPPVPLQPRFGSLRLLTFPKAKIAVERGRFVNDVTRANWGVNCIAFTFGMKGSVFWMQEWRYYHL